jgi:hypothetical protein
MTEIELQNAIKDVIESEILPNLTIFKGGGMKVFLHDIPLTTEFEDDESDRYFPCCIVKTRAGEIENADDPQKTTVEIVIAIKDDSEDMTGHQSLLVVITRIRDYFLKNAGIMGKFRLSYPIKWGISDEVTTPYFVGNVLTIWDTDIMTYSDPNNFL